MGRGHGFIFRGFRAKGKRSALPIPIEIPRTLPQSKLCRSKSLLRTGQKGMVSEIGKGGKVVIQFDGHDEPHRVDLADLSKLVAEVGEVVEVVDDVIIPPCAGCGGFCDRECATCERKLCIRCIPLCIALRHAVRKPDLPEERDVHVDLSDSVTVAFMVIVFLEYPTVAMLHFHTPYLPMPAG